MRKPLLGTALLILSNILLAGPREPLKYTAFVQAEECYSGWVYAYSSQREQGDCIIWNRYWYCAATDQYVLCGQHIYCEDERESYDIDCPLDYSLLLKEVEEGSDEANCISTRSSDCNRLSESGRPDPDTG